MTESTLKLWYMPGNKISDVDRMSLTGLPVDLTNIDTFLRERDIIGICNGQREKLKHNRISFGGSVI